MILHIDGDINRYYVQTLCMIFFPGTNFKVELSQNAIWCGGSSIIKGREPIVNMPTEEIFTSPLRYPSV